MIHTALNQSGLAPVNPVTLKEAKDSDEWPEWEKAIATEVDQLREMGTWELVDRTQQMCCALPAIKP